MSSFDPDLAVAELCQFEILVQHHLRQLREVRDVATGEQFTTRLGKLKSDADHTLRTIKRVKCTCGLEVNKVYVKICPRCGRTIL